VLMKAHLPQRSIGQVLAGHRCSRLFVRRRDALGQLVRHACTERTTLISFDAFRE
jgi:hypothetical protein